MHFVYPLLFILIIFKFPGSQAGFRATTPSEAKTYLKAKEIYYDANTDSITASGKVVILYGKYILEADIINYNIAEDSIFAVGNIKVTKEGGGAVYGEKIFFKNKLKKGLIKEFAAKLDDSSVLAARQALRVDKDNYILEKSVFTPCEFSCDRKPIWLIKSSEARLDRYNQKITYKHSLFEIYGVPLVYIPYFSHPMPNAEAQSGILMPRIKYKDFLLPFYFRVKPNMDFTITPRLSKKYNIVETEFRHRINSGQYQINGSYGNPDKRQVNNLNKAETSRRSRFYIFTEGNFTRNNLNYGFDLNRTSDKAYLTNYYQIYDPYLSSRLYVNSIDKRDYISLESFHFQDLRINDSDVKTPFVFPYIRTHHVINFNEEESILFHVRNNTVKYNTLDNLQAAKTALDLELATDVISDKGHMLSYALMNRSDLYWVDFNNKTDGKQHVWARNIPELSAKWRYPLVKSIRAGTIVKLEPTTMIVHGRKFEPRFNKFGVIDSNKTELSENNIFSKNRFNGTDYHEYGSRLSYGINSSLIHENIYIDSFLGQLLHKRNVTEGGNSEYVGNISLNIQDDVFLFYRFRKDRKVKPIRNELGCNTSSENLKTSLSFTELRNLSKYFSEEGFNITQDKFSQVNFNVNYRLATNLWVGLGANIDISDNKPAKILFKTIKVTYLFDCVSIDAAVTDNFLHDESRGVKKVKSNITFSIGLKVINM